MEGMPWGKRDARGEWQPDILPQPSPLFTWPWKPAKVLKYLFGPVGLLWPYNLAVALLAIVAWLFFTPGFERTASFELGWMAEILARNVVLVILVAGGMHLRLYTTRGQGLKFKYSDKWLATKDPRFLFGNQTWDNVFWSLTSGCIVWTAWEAATLWLYANKLIPYVDFRSHPVYFVLLMVGVVFLRMTHFYFVHRLSHWKPLYKISHYLHHRNINIGPWSGLSMNPIEHLLYFSGVLLHWVIPSNPLHAIFHLMHAGITPALGHTGFHKFAGKGEGGLPNDQYFHYLHHRLFTVNFGNEAVPLDKWFGSFHDGSPEAQAAMLARRAKAGQAEGSRP
jgi:sterol desaturase/sphingolipid hydroxylase (fatty acid hydroxylase superfamily)